MADPGDKLGVAATVGDLPNLPLALRKALEAGDCVLFVGAGIGFYVRDKHGNPAPDGGELARRLASNFGVDTDGDSDLSRTAEIVELRKGRKELETFLRDQLSNLEPDENIRWFPRHIWTPTSMNLNGGSTIARIPIYSAIQFSS